MSADGRTVIDDRLRAVCDLLVATVREESGRHEYDGVVQDLSGPGVAAALARVGRGDPRADDGLEAHLRAFEEGVRIRFGELEMHRRDPLLHITNLDTSCYDRPYAPAGERDAARRQHLARWPDAVDAAVRTLDAVSAPVAAALLPVARGLAGGLDEAEPAAAPAGAALGRLVAHLEECARRGDPEFALGTDALAALMGAEEGLCPDLEQLGQVAGEERARLLAELAAACARLDPHRPAAEVVADLRRDRPGPDADLWAEAAGPVGELIEFCRAKALVPHLDGELRIGPPPRSRSWAMAMMAWSAPDEADAPSWYWLTPPDPSWDAADVEAWQAVFCRTTLPAITAHEVVPGHLSHARALRRVAGAERRVLHSPSFVEGWAHYAEEMLVETGFRGSDPRFRVGVYLEALVRITRLAVAIGLHTGRMSVAEATDRFRRDAMLSGVAARSEAERGLFDPTYGRYAWGKLAISEVRARARDTWGSAFTLSRLHGALLALGSPPIGLLARAVDAG
jgi:hypothetical protein